MNTNLTPPNLRPFNLKLAKAGKPIISRTGKEAMFLAHFPEHSEMNRVWATILAHGESYGFSEEGLHRSEGSAIDLFMASKNLEDLDLCNELTTTRS